ncbi:hypothetical protein COY95_00370 [Candidatus Woesearchaeota archaeon CG_4_10_14_0_8_um_filter_47_5]|nr:MAG: hypothetical protein COY95_00370 [Candidatus Woesearchaeota archaeon CG_4_10_14_0_8_um_filter_47_5]
MAYYSQFPYATKRDPTLMERLGLSDWYHRIARGVLVLGSAAGGVLSANHVAGQRLHDYQTLDTSTAYGCLPNVPAEGVGDLGKLVNLGSVYAHSPAGTAVDATKCIVGAYAEKQAQAVSAGSGSAVGEVGKSAQTLAEGLRSAFGTLTSGGSIDDVFKQAGEGLHGAGTHAQGAVDAITGTVHTVTHAATPYDSIKAILDQGAQLANPGALVGAGLKTFALALLITQGVYTLVPVVQYARARVTSSISSAKTRR